MFSFTARKSLWKLKKVLTSIDIVIELICQFGRTFYNKLYMKWTINKEEQLKNMKSGLLKTLKGMENKDGTIKESCYWNDDTELMTWLSNFMKSVMSFTTFSPQATILNIFWDSKKLQEYITSIFNWLEKTNNKKLARKLLDIYKKTENQNSRRFLKSFIYDSVLYLTNNPINLEDSDPSYHYFRRAEELAHGFVNWPYRLTKQEETVDPYDIDPHKLVEKLADTKKWISVKEVVTILKRLYWDSINFDNLTLKK